MESLGWFDFLSLAVMAVSGIIAFYRGLVRESLGLTAWILAAVAGLYGLPLLTPLYDKIFATQLLTDIAAGVTVALISLVVFIIIVGRITRKVRESSLSGLDRILGFAFGVLRGALIVILMYVLGLVVMPADTQKLGENNSLITYIEDSLEYSKTFLPDSVAKDLSAKQKEALKAKASSAKDKTIKDKDKTGTDSLFDKLNEPTPKPSGKDKENGYDDSERETLDELVDTIDAEHAEDAKENPSKAEGSPQVEIPLLMDEPASSPASAAESGK